MIKLHGQTEEYALFTDGDSAVVIEKTTNLVDHIGTLSSLSSLLPWKINSRDRLDSTYYDLAKGAIADLRVHAVVASGRMYTIPKGAQEEAKRGLEWRKEHGRGGTPVGVNSARTLAAGGQIGINKVRHIAKYFPRHEVDKKAKGYKPGQDNFPSNGRIAWALWGGDTAWRWAKAIVESENKKALKSDGYIVANDNLEYDDYAPAASYDSDTNAFREAYENCDASGPEFVARVRLDGSGIDRIYKIEETGDVCVWDGSGWDDMAHVDSDIMTYDKSLDEPYDKAEKSHILIDTDSALIITARLQENPYRCVQISDLSQEELALVEAAADEIDWTIVDMAITAAGEDPIGAEGDGKYTPEERSQRARRQVRDKGGKFSAMGSRVVIQGAEDATGRGSITKINPDTSSVTVKLDSGESVEVPAVATQTEEDYMRSMSGTRPNDDVTPSVDVSGIFGQPRTPMDRPNVRIPGTLPALGSGDMQTALNNYPAWVKSQRDLGVDLDVGSGPPAGKSTEQKVADYVAERTKTTGYDYTNPGDIRKHPVFKDIFKNKKYHMYYDPIGVFGSAAAGPAGEPLTPQTSDVDPMYLAIVSPDDPRAVFDLVSIVPAGTKSLAPTTFKRVNGSWEKDDQILLDLSSATPPPVVALDGQNFIDVLGQVDGDAGKKDKEKVENPEENPEESQEAPAVTAAGGADRNRGGAEHLRRYWLYGRGALKIRWNTPGDWTRCYKQLAKYMGPRAKGYCALRHKEATGVYPGSKYNIGKKNAKLRAAGFIDTPILEEHAVIAAIELRARANAARGRVLLSGGAVVDGARFTIPLVIPEECESGDGRTFVKESITIRELPLPLLWQIKTGTGHDGSVVVGRIDSMERTDQGIGNASGVFDTGAYGIEAQRMVENGFMRGVSADLDQFEAKEEELAADADEADGKIGGQKIKITAARVMAVTIVPKPAFEECTIELYRAAEEEQQEENQVVQDGIYTDEMDALEAQSIVACGMIAGAIPAVPPAQWFNSPKLDGPTPLTVTDEGRVFGHIAAWHVDHIGLSYGTKPPKSKSNYSYFHTGVVRADDSKDYAVGQLTLAGGHASLEASALDAARHYDDTGSAIADVHAGEDKFGIWVAGALRPNATPEQIRVLRASAPSGDWRPIKGSLELVAVCQVNVPGFPIARARVASGQVYALVAAGAQVLARMKADPLNDLSTRLARLEYQSNPDLVSKAEEAKKKIAEFTTARNEQLAARAEELSSRVRSTEEYDSAGYMPRNLRDKLAKSKKALPDGSYPIRNVDELKAAIAGYGRGKKSKRAAIRSHIMRRARSLDKADLIPDKWKSASIIEEDIADLRTIAAEAAAKTVEQAELTAEGLQAGGVIVAEESELAEALIKIVEKHGKFNSDDTGVWGGYEPAATNDKKEMGVICANCILYEGGSSCKIIDAAVEPGGYCRFALIPDGVVKKPEATSTVKE